MNIIILLFLISSIIIVLCLKKLNMIIAGNIYVFCSFIIFLLYSLLNDSLFISSLPKLLMSKEIYNFVYSSLNNRNYVFTYIAILSFITVVQVIIAFILLQKKILSSKYVFESKNNSNNNTSYNRNIQIYKEEVEEKTISLNKVHISLCKMLN